MIAAMPLWPRHSSSSVIRRAAVQTSRIVPQAYFLPQHHIRHAVGDGFSSGDQSVPSLPWQLSFAGEQWLNTDYAVCAPDTTLRYAFKTWDVGIFGGKRVSERLKV